jgi:predicted nucleic acid-binding protein
MDAADRPVVSNTTPLIKLAGVGLLDLLPQIYGSIWIAEAVRDEFVAGMRPDDPVLDSLPWPDDPVLDSLPWPDDPVLDSLPWMRIVPSPPADPSLHRGLDVGEAATIALAMTAHARIVLLDEQLARRVARQRGLPIVGTLGVLVTARQTGRIPAVKPIVDMLIAQGRRISPSLRSQVLRAVGEEE